MRADLGFLLIGVGLAGIYLVLSGKFPPQGANNGNSNSSKSINDTPQNTNASSVGSAGVSYQSALRLPRASNGGMR